MKRLLLISMFIGALPLTLAAQDDDMYFVPQKKSVQKVTDNYGIPKDVYYSGSNRDIDEYNRRYTSSYYEVLGSDSTKNDTISFSSERGVYPDSISDEDYKYTKKMSRFDDYDLAEAYWTGFDDGRFGWHSPWYYSRYGWYHPWRYGWYDPWYYGWYDPWYYGWYDPWYYGWYGPRYGGWGHYYIVGGGGRYHANTIGAGSIRRDGIVHGASGRYASGRSADRSRYSNRTVSGRSRYSNSGTRSSGRSTYRGSRSNSSYGSSFDTSRSSGSYGGGSRSGGGSFGGGSAGGGSRGGGGGSRMGGRR